LATLRTALALAAGLAAAGAVAQGTAAPAVRDPADPRAEAPPLVHRSPFATYRVFTGDGPGSWRGANDEVARIGGWKAYAREAYEASKAAQPAPGEAAQTPAAPQEPGVPRTR
jgi:hypothetical protein